MPASPEAVALVKKRADDLDNFGLCLAGALGVALACGVGKLVVDMKKAPTGPSRRKKPWELA